MFYISKTFRIRWFACVSCVFYGQGDKN